MTLRAWRSPKVFDRKVSGAQTAQRNVQDGIKPGADRRRRPGRNHQYPATGARIGRTSFYTAPRAPQNRAALDTEVQELLKQIEDIATDTSFNGISVLSANQTVTLQSGANPSQTLQVAVAGATTRDLKISRLAVSSMALAVSTISTIDIALKSVTSLRSTLGAFQNRLEFTVSTLAIQEENAAASESYIRDADIAQETIAFYPVNPDSCGIGYGDAGAGEYASTGGVESVGLRGKNTAVRDTRGKLKEERSWDLELTRISRR